MIAKISDSINKIISPQLHSDGFKGSGKSFRRISEDIVHTFQIQIKKGGGGFCVEYAIHPIFVENILGKPIDLKKITVYDCDLRKRLSVGIADQWWYYETNTQSMDYAMDNVVEQYQSICKPELDKFNNSKNTFGGLTVDDIVNKNSFISEFMVTDSRLALLLAKIRFYENDFFESIKFSKFGINVSGKMAKSIIANFKSLILKCEANQQSRQKI